MTASKVQSERAAQLAYDRSGQGEPLVLLHGQGFSRRSFDPSSRRSQPGAT